MKKETIIQLTLLGVGMIVGAALALTFLTVEAVRKAPPTPVYRGNPTTPCPYAGGMTTCYLVPVR